MDDGRNDFDFLEGDWLVAHQRLKERLAGCTEWETFTGRCTLYKTMGGLGNFDDNIVNLPGGAYRAMAMRSFNPETRQWAIWWLDGRWPHSVDVPVVGAFEDGVGSFYCEDAHKGMPIRVRFRWSDTRTGAPHWEQAFSTDGGETWEVNWRMRFTRADKT